MNDLIKKEEVDVVLQAIESGKFFAEADWWNTDRNEETLIERQLIFDVADALVKSWEKRTLE